MFKNEEYYNRINELFSDDVPLNPENFDNQSNFSSDFSNQEDFNNSGSTDDITDKKKAQSSEFGREQDLNVIESDECLDSGFNQEIFNILKSNDRGDNQNSGSKQDNYKVAISQQVSQHVENLMFLDQAETGQIETENATRQLTYEGWEAYLQSPSAPIFAYTFDRGRIIPLNKNSHDTISDIADASKVQSQALKVRNEDIGKIEIVDPDCDQDTVEILMSVIAERLSVHIENLRLLDETEHSRQQLDKSAAELETVSKVSTAAATILEPKTLLQSVVDLTSYSFKLYLTSVYLLNDTGDLLELTAASGKIGHAMLEEGSHIGIHQKGSIIAKAARDRETVNISNTSKESDYYYNHLLPNVLSEMSIPLIVGEKLIGVINFSADSINHFTKEDTRTFTTLASQTAIALRNAQLYADQIETVARLKELDRLKSSFLANMSHELRTPLNSILGFTQVILEGLDGPLTDDMEMDLGLIEKNGQHLLNLINEVLDMAKIESGRLSLRLEPILLNEILKDVINSSSPLVRGDVELINKCQLSDDIFIMADTVRLRQILLNIVSNALKFTNNGSVRIETEQFDEKVQIRVIDTGIGIPPNKLESIFEAFSQVDTSTTRKVGGTGLGLPISRRLAEMHGGWLWAQSNGIPEDGSIFYLELPIGEINT